MNLPSQKYALNRRQLSHKRSFLRHAYRTFTLQRYWVEEAEAPFRCRLQKDGLKFSRDISKWEARAPAKRISTKRNDEAADECTGENEGSSGGTGGCSSDMGGGRGMEWGGGASFFAFPLVVHNSHAHHVVSASSTTCDSNSANSAIPPQHVVEDITPPCEPCTDTLVEERPGARA